MFNARQEKQIPTLDSVKSLELQQNLQHSLLLFLWMKKIQLNTTKYCSWFQ